MLTSLKRLFTENIGLKITALVLALIAWFYIVDELKKGTEEEMQFLKKILPSEGMVAKKLMIRPIFVGKPRYGYDVINSQVVIVPDSCIVVGPKDTLGRIRYIYTLPIDITGSSKPFTESVSLNPVAPGIYMEETLVQVTVPVEKV